VQQGWMRDFLVEVGSGTWSRPDVHLGPPRSVLRASTVGVPSQALTGPKGPRSWHSRVRTGPSTLVTDGGGADLEPVQTHRVHALSARECRDLLETAVIGRVVFTDRALPSVLPVAFIVDRASVVIRTASGSRLARAAQGAVLAFEADEVDQRAGSAWSVVVTGQAQVESDLAELARLDGLLSSWVPGLKETFIRIPLTMVSGRRLSGIPSMAAQRRSLSPPDGDRSAAPAGERSEAGVTRTDTWW